MQIVMSLLRDDNRTPESNEKFPLKSTEDIKHFLSPPLLHKVQPSVFQQVTHPWVPLSVIKMCIISQTLSLWASSQRLEPPL